jgi:hypothetical protein
VITENILETIGNNITNNENNEDFMQIIAQNRKPNIL